MLGIGAVGPWRDSSTGMGQAASPVAEGPGSSAAADKGLEWPWDPASRCYLAEMHQTEVQCSSPYSVDLSLPGRLLRLPEGGLPSQEKLLPALTLP